MEKNLFYGGIIEDLHESILNEQHNFGYFDWYKFGELGKYDPAMDSVEVVVNVLEALTAMFDKKTASILLHNTGVV